MRRLGRMSGRGVAIYGEARTPVTYEINVYSSGQLKSASGRISADPLALHKMFEAPKHVQLDLQGGGSLSFLISEMSGMSDEASIQVSGPIPGY